MKFSQIQASDEELRVILESGFLLREIGCLEEAESIFSGMIEWIPKSEIPCVGLANIEMQRGQFKLAEELCREGLRRNPSSLYARVHQAEALLFQNNRIEAEAELRNIIEEDPKSAHSRTAQALLDVMDFICEGL